MIQELTLDDVLSVLKKRPEQCVLGWQRDDEAHHTARG